MTPLHTWLWLTSTATRTHTQPNDDQFYSYVVRVCLNTFALWVCFSKSVCLSLWLCEYVSPCVCSNLTFYSVLAVKELTIDLPSSVSLSQHDARIRTRLKIDDALTHPHTLYLCTVIIRLSELGRSGFHSTDGATAANRPITADTGREVV